MGAGILPIALYRGTLFLLLGKERNNLWSDFGGSSINKEEIFKTAIREGCEELNGFFGTEDELAIKVKNNNIMQIGFEERVKRSKKLIYTTFLFNTKYDKNLPYYFNNVNKFAELHLSEHVNKNHNGLFEKSEINWFTIDDLKKNIIHLRPWYIPFIESVIKNEKKIIAIIKENDKLY